MSKSYSLIDIVFIIALYLAAWYGGFKHGEHFTLKRIEANVKANTEKYRYHIDSLLRDLEFVANASDSAKRAVVERELEYLNRYIKSRFND